MKPTDNNFPVGDSEILLVEIYPSQGSKILFVTCYNPPSASVSNFNSQLDNILAKIYTKVCVWVILICLMCNGVIVLHLII